MRGDVTLLHTADFHLGRLAGLGGKTKLYHQILFAALERVLDLAVAEADVLLMVGDTLDEAPVRQDIAGGLAERAAGRMLAALEESPRLHLVLIVGNHDRAVAYDQGEWRRLAAHPRAEVVGEPRMVELEEPGLRIAALPWMGAGAAEWHDWPADASAEAPAGGPVIAAAHACFPTALTGTQDYVLSEAEVATWPVAYVALGHYHSGPASQVGDTPVVYAGAPEILDVAQRGRGRVVRVRVPSEGPAEWEPVAVGELEGKGSVEWDWASLPEPRLESLRRRLATEADEKAWMRVRVTGLRQSVRPPALQAVADELADRFFYLDLRDETRPALDPESVEAGEGEPVLAHFLSRGTAELKAAEAELAKARKAGDEEAIAEAAETVGALREALALGYSVLSPEPE